MSYFPHKLHVDEMSENLYLEPYDIMKVRRILCSQM
jgi:hypothetical protein